MERKSAETLGGERADPRRGLDPRVLAHIERVVVAARAAGKSVSVCGELAADPDGSKILVGLGVNALSVAPSRFAALKSELAETTRAQCEAAARAALARGTTSG
jgi:phosphoenolpyruvate-protein kinase (PTS system EI component)